MQRHNPNSATSADGMATSNSINNNNNRIRQHSRGMMSSSSSGRSSNTNTNGNTNSNTNSNNNNGGFESSLPSLRDQRRNQSTGTPSLFQQNQQNQQQRQGPLHLEKNSIDEDKGSSLVPIWALHSGVTSKLIDHSTKATGVSTSGAAAISEYSGGTKAWIRSGKKWIITNNNNTNTNTNTNTNNRNRNRTGGAGGGNFSNRNVKIHPTAVSSYGTNFQVPNEQNGSTIGMNNHSRRTHANAQDAASAFASSSTATATATATAGLYTRHRQRLTTTPGGFPYMPALHLVRKKNEMGDGSDGGGGGGLGISSGTGIARSDGIYVDQQQRFQSSYLLNAKPMSSPFSNKNLLSLDEDDDDDDDGRGRTHAHGSKREDSSERSASVFPSLAATTMRDTSSHGSVSAGIQMQSSSGYDSEREERLREWKEQFVQKFINDGDATTTPGRAVTTIRRSKSLDSDCDSETNTQKVRLTEWKEEQYRRSAKLKELKGSIGAGSYLRPPIRKTQGFSYSFAKSSNVNSITNRTRAKAQDDHSVRIRTVSSDSADEGYIDHEGYDSDATRRQRLKEWKEQFAHVDVPLNNGTNIHSPTMKPKRFSSTTAETGVDGGSEPLETIHLSSAIKQSRRSREVPGGGIFPITSPQRNKNEVPKSPGSSFQSPRRRIDVVKSSVKPGRASLPPLTPPRNANAIGNNLTPKTVNGKHVKQIQKDDTAEIIQPEADSSPSQDEEEESQVVKAAKFLLGLSPTSLSGIGQPTGDCLISIALELGSPCKILPSLSVDNVSEHFNRVIYPEEEGAPGLQEIERDRGFVPIINTSFNLVDFSAKESPLPTWDNCLFVKAEGARSGRIFLTKSHLIFIYEDEVSDSLLARYGWNRSQIDNLLLETEVSSRGATPVNVPLDESGEGGGVELIGSDYNKVNVMDLLEESFENDETLGAPVNDQDKENLVDKMEECNNSALETSLTPNDDLNVPIEVQKRVDGRNLSRDREFKSSLSPDEIQRHRYLDDLPSINLSSSSMDSLVDYEQTNDRDANEDVVSQCIISAINEEAHMLLQEDERTTSFSTMDRTETSNKSCPQQDCRDLHGNQTNLSTFSEIDMDIDPDQERSLYISGEVDMKREYIGLKWPLSKLAEIFNRRYMMKEVGLEIFAPSSSQLTTSSLRQVTMGSTSKGGANAADEIDVPLGPLSHLSVFLVIPEFDEKPMSPFRRKPVTRRDTFVEALKGRSVNLNDAHWQGPPRLQRKWHWRRSDKTYTLSVLTRTWRKGHISNLDYLMRLNAIAGRSFHDPGNYPIMPWVLSNFTSASVPDLCDERNYRDLSKPMGALDPIRLQKFQEKYASLCASLDTAIPPFMYGSHYSNTGGVVLHYLVRVRPFAGLHRQLQVRFH
jgi:hypothetical protein